MVLAARLRMHGDLLSPAAAESRAAAPDDREFEEQEVTKDDEGTERMHAPGDQED